MVVIGVLRVSHNLWQVLQGTLQTGILYKWLMLGVMRDLTSHLYNITRVSPILIFMCGKDKDHGINYFHCVIDLKHDASIGPRWRHLYLCTHSQPIITLPKILLSVLSVIYCKGTLTGFDFHTVHPSARERGRKKKYIYIYIYCVRKILEEELL
jgi:hypothetical protein